jgi:hypothetical protein
MPDVLITPNSSSITLHSGSADLLVGRIGLLLADMNYSSSFHRFTGSATFTGPVSSSTFSGSLSGTSSFSVSASHAQTVGGTNAFIQNGNSFGTTALIGTNDANRVDIESSGVPRLTIAANGYIGLNETVPSTRLTLVGSGSADTRISSSEQFLNNSILIRNVNTASNQSIISFDSGGGGSSAIGFSRGPSFDTTLIFYTNPISSASPRGMREQMIITSTGSVGLGTSTPTAKLDINLSSSMTASGDVGLAIRKGSGSVSQNFIVSRNFDGSTSHLLSSDVNGHIQNSLFFSGVERVFNHTSLGSYINNVNYLSGGLSLGTGSSLQYYGLYVNSGSTSGSAFFNLGLNRSVQIGNTSYSNASNVLTVRMDDTGQGVVRLQNLHVSSGVDAGIGMIANLTNNTGSAILNAGGLYFLKEGTWTSDTTSYDSYFRLDTTENNVTSEKIRVTSAGFVGIGTSTPSNKLHVFQGIAQVDVGASYGINVGDVRIRSVSTGEDDLILSNLGSTSLDGLRFSNTSSWNYDVWAGLNYFITGSSGIVKPGGPRAFRQNVAGATGSILLSANGQFDLFISASSISSSLVGVGTNSPAAKLDVVTSIAASNVILARGTNGVLFNVTDDLSDSLFSVNDSSGLPVLEVFADDRVVAGRYNQNDLVLSNGNLGLGFNAPANKLSVYGNAQITGSLGIGCSPSTGSFSSQVHISGSGSGSAIYAFKFDRVAMDTVTTGGGYTFKAWLKIYVDNVSGFTGSSTYYMPIYS